MQRSRYSARCEAAASPIEKVYYESKPLILTLFAFYGLTSTQANNFFVKLNIFTLFILAAYLTYSRLVHRGYIDKRTR